VLRALARNLETSSGQIRADAVSADFGAHDPEREARTPGTPLGGYEIVEIAVRAGSPVLGHRPDEVEWPPGIVLVAVRRGDEIAAPIAAPPLQGGERLILLAPAAPRAENERTFVSS
jgi:TrkA-C domain